MRSTTCIRDANASPEQVSTGTPLWSASLHVPPAFRGTVSRRKISESESRRMVGVTKPRREEEAIVRYAPLRRRSAKIAPPEFFIRVEPEPAFGDSAQQAHPDVENRPICRRSCVVVCLEAVREPGDALGVILGHDVFAGIDVVDEPGPKVGNPRQLNWIGAGRRAMCASAAATLGAIAMAFSKHCAAATYAPCRYWTTPSMFQANDPAFPPGSPDTDARLPGACRCAGKQALRSACP